MPGTGAVEKPHLELVGELRSAKHGLCQETSPNPKLENLGENNKNQKPTCDL